MFTVLVTQALVGTALRPGFASQGLSGIRNRRGMRPLQFDIHDASNVDINVIHTPISSMLSNSLSLAEEAVSTYSKVDKIGLIGFMANYIEVAIDLGSNVFKGVGIQNSYGLSIIVFTLFSK
ncbi:hypothetical protein EON65_06170 [archaeon]|nr:MAG: hypothetical protein EON65_06170 [archaeon]